MADPLSLLRQFHLNKKEIVEKNNLICFGEYCWPKDVKTNYTKYKNPEQRNQASEYYTLETLVFFLKNASTSHANYIKAAAEAKVPFVTVPDKKHLLAYLSGETATVSSIDKSAPIPIPVSADGSRKLDSSYTLASNSSSAAPTEDGPPAKIARHNDHEIQKAKEKFSEQLDSRGIRKALAPTTAPVSSEANSSLAESLSIEKINALKAKRLAKKRNTIIDAESDLCKEGGDGVEGEREILHKMDLGQTKEIQSRERVWRDRSTILQSSGKNFYKSIILDILQNIRNPDGMKKPGSSMPPPAVNASNSTGAGTIGGSGGTMPGRSITTPAGMTGSSTTAQTQQYNRYDQERFSRTDSSIGFRIDTTGTYHGLTLKSVTEGTLPQTTAGPGNPPSANSIGNNGVSHRSHGVTGMPGPHTPKKRQSKTPIIIIPATTTSVITLLNAKSILQDLKYTECPPDARRENELLIQRRKADGTTVPYRVIDNPLKLQPEEWDRVVAVFVQGPAWQFKGWPWHSNPVEIFSNIKAFHVKFDEAKLDANVAKWNVDVIELSRHKRHLDRANLLKFWGSLDSFMYKHKHHLRC